ncbi:hypothetical protein [Ruegeria sp. HKCCA6837]|uniref:hypothetical protein n=1 Tax=Ruegeria sp. HKCCA6837 TaxID=2682989 RepID=UPI001489C7ED|nr:hypothetical protein [Ruegeria sp. HKCCA6837]
MRQIKITTKATDAQLEALNTKIEKNMQRKSEAQAKLSRLETQLRTSEEINTDRPGTIKGQIDRLQKELLELGATLDQYRSEQSDLKATLLQPLAERLCKINGKASTYTLDAGDLRVLAQEAEDVLIQKGVAQKNRAGAEIEFRPAGKPASNRYANMAGASITTRVKLRRATDGWRLLDAARDRCFVNQPEFRQIRVRPAAHDDILRKATDGITVLSDDAEI